MDAPPLGCSSSRKRCFLLNNCVTLGGAVLMLLSRGAKSFEMIMAARFIYGVSAGEAEATLHDCSHYFLPRWVLLLTPPPPSPFTPSGIGLSAHSIYLVECAPKRLRGMVGVTVATFASFGKFLAQLLGIR